MTEETSQPTSAEVTGPLTESAAAELLQNWRDESEEQQSPKIDSARAKANAAEEAAEAAEAELAPAEAESEAETDEAETTDNTDAAESDDSYLHGNSRTRLRDGTEVTVGELKKAYDEAREFRRQQAEFNSQRKEHEAKAAQIAQQEQLFAKTIEQAIAAVQRTLPPEPDVQLKKDDPIRYFLEKDERDAQVQEINRLHQAQLASNERAQAEQAEQFQKHIEQEQSRLFERVPELRNEGKRREFFNDLVASGKEYYGFSEEELGNVHDHRVMLMAKDALAYRKLQAAKPKAVEKSKAAKPVAKPGERAAPNSAVSATVKSKFERFTKTRSIDDAGKLLADFD